MNKKVDAPTWMYERQIKLRASKEAAVIAKRDKARRRKEIGTWVRLVTSLIVFTWLFVTADEAAMSMFGMIGAALSAVLLTVLIVYRMYPEGDEDEEG